MRVGLYQNDGRPLAAVKSDEMAREVFEGLEDRRRNETLAVRALGDEELPSPPEMVHQLRTLGYLD